MKQKMQSLDGIVISAKDAARLIGKSTVWLAKLVTDDFIKPGQKQGRETVYKPADVAQGYARYLTDESRRSSKSATLSEVQAARATEIRLRIAREQHELIELDEALAVLDEIIGGLKADFNGLAASVTRDQGLRLTIEEKTDAIFKRHADALKQKAKSLREGGTAPDPDAEDDT